MIITVCSFWIAKDNKQKLLSLGGLETLYLLFFSLVIIDYNSLATKQYQIPQFLFIYFTCYSFSLFISRALLFKQIKIIFYCTNILTWVTSILLLSQLLSGSASFTGDGVRLVAGSSNNPINTGYLGAYCCTTSLIIFFTNKVKISVKIYSVLAFITGFYITLLSGTRSALIFCCISIFLILIAMIWLKISPSYQSIKTTNQTIFFNNLIILLLGFSLITFTLSSNLADNLWGADNLWMQNVSDQFSRLGTISSIFFGDEYTKLDDSASGRVILYNNAISIFIENPIFGGGIYSAGNVHNAFLQSASELGILGLLTFSIPFFYLGLLCIKNFFTINLSTNFYYKNSDYWTINLFCVILFIQATCLWSFHGDPYRSYIPLCAIGILISYFKLPVFNKKRSKYKNKLYR
ncbi:hypothetical protein BJP34_32320 [Moorena producens PAL-8-15-08-1]|uniref:O-antigen ligase-related domain-containing protein n=1 Tax=Moorena producens PAL-8-15-08-1 TaxID=1458985 RepID=A0A1D8U119_9CYAN|nr:O-antigen ligase family protein [Moorena producens]AOX03494.1 hypothetical protein BJP34_32320 [Moorena producens PAL-8-15-08-1]